MHFQFRCHLCNITISSQRTKHCSVCNKCVHVFDHHCKWLNQCIGRRNYLWFFLSVVTAILMSLVYIALSIIILFYYHYDKHVLEPWNSFENRSNFSGNFTQGVTFVFNMRNATSFLYCNKWVTFY